jgi:ribonucleotide reductase alpha subunit
MHRFTVINSKNEHVPLDFTKTYNKLVKLINIHPKLDISADVVTQQTISSIVDGISTYQLDLLSSSICATLSTEHIDYDKLAVRIYIDSLHKYTDANMLTTLNKINALVNTKGEYLDLLNPKLIKFVMHYIEDIHAMFDYTRDYDFDYFGIQTLRKAYLLKNQFIDGSKKNNIIERPQHLWMRVAIGIHMHAINDFGELYPMYTISDIKSTYDLISQKYYTHATPTLFNAGCNRSALSSCFLLEIPDDLNGIYNMLANTAKISKWSGGIGVAISKVRAKGSLIKSTNGVSEGLVPLMKLFNQSALYVSQGGGKRKGSTATYLEPWHADIFDFLETRKPLGDDATKCKDLFLALWVPDLFIKRLIEAIESKQKVLWSLMCPDQCPGLVDSHGLQFEELYCKYENENRFVKQVDIKTLWDEILTLQLEAGVPYLMYKDHANNKSNQNNLGTIQSSNLCVSGDTLVLTETGYYPISSLVNQTISIWDGKQFTNCPVVQTGSNRQLLRVTTSDGCELDCTPYHKFNVERDGKNMFIEARNLLITDKLVEYSFPIIEKYNDYYDIEIIPVNSEKKYKLSWLNEFINTYGFIVKHAREFKIIINYSSSIVLKRVKLLCNTLGMNPVMRNLGNKSSLTFYNDDYHTIALLTNLAKCKIFKDTTKYSEEIDIGINNIEEIPGYHDTFCVRSPKTDMVMFNGILTHNCSEIVIHTDHDNIGVCNLASVCLGKFAEYLDNKPYYNYKKLYDTVCQMTINLNKVLKSNYYCVEEGKYSDLQNAPLGIGVQGLADVFIKSRLAFTSPEAKQINKYIFETIYYAAMETSCMLAKKEGVYPNYHSSMVAKGLLQFDLWNVTPELKLWDWQTLRTNISKYGIRNSLLVALMPTASTASIMGSSENFEPITSNIYARVVLSGKFQIVNKYLVNDLMKLGLWNDEMKNEIISNNGSIQNIDSIPTDIKKIYKIVWEYQLSDLIKMDADRSAYVCQSSSSNRYVTNPTIGKLTKMHIYAWKCGLKTSSYYIKTQAKVDAVKFSVTTKKKTTIEVEEESECMMCSA